MRPTRLLCFTSDATICYFWMSKFKVPLHRTLGKLRRKIEFECGWENWHVCAYTGSLEIEGSREVLVCENVLELLWPPAQSLPRTGQWQSKVTSSTLRVLASPHHSMQRLAEEDSFIFQTKVNFGTQHCRQNWPIKNCIRHSPSLLHEFKVVTI